MGVGGGGSKLVRETIFDSEAMHNDGNQPISVIPSALGISTLRNDKINIGGVFAFFQAHTSAKTQQFVAPAHAYKCWGSEIL